MNQFSLLPVVSVDRGRPVASSVDVAAYFDKKHYHVLRDIRRLCEEASAAFTESNFGFSVYKDSTGRSHPHCLMTKNGFVLLVMGFTGPKALEFKLAYIAAFGWLFLFFQLHISRRIG